MLLGTTCSTVELISAGVAIERFPRSAVNAAGLLLNVPCTVALPFIPSVALMALDLGLWGFLSSFCIVGASTLRVFALSL